MTVSVHESGRHLFPGSGFPQETGGPGAPGCAANLALPPFAGNDAYRRAMAEFVVPVVTAFRPDAIVTQCGVDHHHADPLAHMLTTMELYPELWATLDALADDLLRRALGCPGRRRIQPVCRTAARLGAAGPSHGRQARHRTRCPSAGASGRGYWDATSLHACGPKTTRRRPNPIATA